MEQADPQQLFTHVRIVMGMVIGLGITRLLAGVAVFIQHPHRHRVSAIHMMWVASILLELILFWWWEFQLSRMPLWNFGVFLFLVGYAVVLFMLSTLLFPDSISEYSGYEDFFIKRRRWFFGLLAATFFFDIADTIIKGQEHWSRLSGDYLLQVPIGLLLCLVGCLSTRRTVQLAIVLLHIAYQLYWTVRVFYTMP